jgi:hypothetical protein
MTPIILSKLGVCQNTSRLLCFLSSFYGGLDLRDLFIEQGIGQLEFIIRHLRSPGMVGSLLHHVLGWFQYNVGVSYCILQHPGPPLPHLEGQCFLSVRDFLRSVHGSLEFSDQQITPKQRLHNFYLMDLALQAKFSPSELRSINLCRLSFNATMASDLTNASGTHLADGITDGRILPSQSLPRGAKVNQPSPDSRSWAAWRKLLRLFSSLDGTLHATHTLGPWTVSGPDLTCKWPFYYSSSKQLLFQPTGDSFQTHQPIRDRIFAFTPTETHNNLPNHSRLHQEGTAGASATFPFLRKKQ